MSISDKIQRLRTAKSNIAAAITAKGGIVDGRDGFEEFADDIATISAGANLDDFISGKMTEVTSNLEVIPDFAFSAKGDLETVNLPEATYIGRFAFSSAAGATSGSGSGSNAEDGEGGEGDEGEDMNFNNKKLVTVVMPKVTNIEASAFAGDENLEITSLPATLLVIQDKAFQSCPKVQLTAFPENLTYLGDAALDVQDNLDLDTLPATLMYLGSGVTREQITTYLSQYVDSETGILDLSQVPAQWLQVEISDNNVLHHNNRFDGINLGTTIEIPSGALTLASRLFSGVVNGVDTIILPEGLLRIGSGAFDGCNALTTLNLPDSLTDIYDNVFSDCQALTTLDLANTQLTSIGSSAFYNCQALTTLTLPNTLTSIGGSAFSDCWALTSLTLPENLESIGNEAFGRCFALTSLIMPSSITSIGDNAFQMCNALTIVDMTAFDGSTVPYLASSSAFYADPHAEGFKFIFATQEALNAFANETNWSDLAQYFEVQA